MQESGLEFEATPPRATLKKAFQHNLITDEEDWLASIKGRDLLAHTYDEGTANRVAQNVIRVYNQIFTDLYHKLKAIYDNEYPNAK